MGSPIANGEPGDGSAGKFRRENQIRTGSGRRGSVGGQTRSCSSQEASRAASTGLRVPGGSSLCRECGCTCRHEPAYTFIPGRGNPGGTSTHPGVPISRRKGMSAHREGKELPGAYGTPGRRRWTGTGEVRRGRIEGTSGNAGDGSVG